MTLRIGVGAARGGEPSSAGWSRARSQRQLQDDAASPLDERTDPRCPRDAPRSRRRSGTGSGRGRGIATEASSYPPASFTPRPRPGLFVDKGAVLEALDGPGVCLINTASEPDFRGAEPSRYGRPGHIPGSVNLAWPSLTLAETNVLIPLDEAAERIEALGAARAERIVCYCGGGMSATMALFLLHRLGYDNVALHDARWPNGRATRRCRSRAGKAA